MATERVWVWLDDDYGIQHLATPPDAIEMAWESETACALDGDVRRVTFENVDRGKACARCVAAPYSLAGDGRGPP
jgi:hypothetical protein